MRQRVRQTHKLIYLSSRVVYIHTCIYTCLYTYIHICVYIYPHVSQWIWSDNNIVRILPHHDTPVRTDQQVLNRRKSVSLSQHFRLFPLFSRLCFQLLGMLGIGSNEPRRTHWHNGDSPAAAPQSIHPLFSSDLLPAMTGAVWPQQQGLSLTAQFDASFLDFKLWQSAVAKVPS